MKHESRSCTKCGRSALTENKYSKTVSFFGVFSPAFLRFPSVYATAAGEGRPGRDPRTVVTSPESIKDTFCAHAIKTIYVPDDLTRSFAGTDRSRNDTARIAPRTGIGMKNSDWPATRVSFVAARCYRRGRETARENGHAVFYPFENTRVPLQVSPLGSLRVERVPDFALLVQTSPRSKASSPPVRSRTEITSRRFTCSRGFHATTLPTSYVTNTQTLRTKHVI